MSAGPATAAPRTARRGLMATVRRWFDTSAGTAVADEAAQRVDWLRAIPFAAMHLACLA